jgi:hypothetical protein
VRQGLLEEVELFVVHDEGRGGCFGDAGPQSRVVAEECAGVMERGVVVCCAVVVGQQDYGSGCGCQYCWRRSRLDVVGRVNVSPSPRQAC